MNLTVLCRNIILETVQMLFEIPNVGFGFTGRYFKNTPLKIVQRN